MPVATLTFKLSTSPPSGLGPAPPSICRPAGCAWRVAWTRDAARACCLLARKTAVLVVCPKALSRTNHAHALSAAQTPNKRTMSKRSAVTATPRNSFRQNTALPALLGRRDTPARGACLQHAVAQPPHRVAQPIALIAHHQHRGLPQYEGGGGCGAGLSSGAQHQPAPLLRIGQRLGQAPAGVEKWERATAGCRQEGRAGWRARRGSRASLLPLRRSTAANLPVLRRKPDPLLPAPAASLHVLHMRRKPGAAARPAAGQGGALTWWSAPAAAPLPRRWPC